MKKVYPAHKKDLISVFMFLAFLLISAIAINLFTDARIIPSQGERLGISTEAEIPSDTNN